VCAFLVLDGGAAVDGERAIAELKSRIAGFKVPKRVWCLASLPRNAMGKVQKKLLRDQYAATFVTAGR